MSGNRIFSRTRQRLDKMSERQRNSLKNETQEQHNLRLNQDASSCKVHRANESIEEHNRRLNQDVTSSKARRANESIEEHNLRLNQVATSSKVCRADESVQEHICRVNQNTASHIITRKGTGDKKAAEKAAEIASEDYAFNFNLSLRD
jgi:hypothetical protein